MAVLSKEEWIKAAREMPENDTFSGYALDNFWDENYSEKYEVQETGDLAAGFSGGWEGQKAIGNNLLAVGGMIIGNEEYRDEALADAALNEAEAAKWSDGRTTRVEDIDGLGSVIDYAQFTLGSLGPSVGVSASTAGAGYFLAGLAAKKLISLTSNAVSKNLTKSLVSSGIKPEIAKKTAQNQTSQYVAKVVSDRAARKIAKDKGEKFVAEKFPDKLVENLFKSQAKRLGAYVGVATAGYGTGVGDLYGTSTQAGEMSVTKSLVGAVPYAAADTLVGSVVVGGLGRKAASEVGEQVTKALNLGVKGKVVAGVVNPITLGAITGGVSESIQEELNIQIRASSDPTFDPDGAEAWSQRVNSFSAGAIGGKAFGIPGSIKQAMSESAIVKEAKVVDQQLTDEADSNLRMGRVLSLEELQESLKKKREVKDVLLKSDEIATAVEKRNKEQTAADRAADKEVKKVTDLLAQETKANKKADTGAEITPAPVTPVTPEAVTPVTPEAVTPVTQSKSDEVNSKLAAARVTNTLSDLMIPYRKNQINLKAPRNGLSPVKKVIEIVTPLMGYDGISERVTYSGIAKGVDRIEILKEGNRNGYKLDGGEFTPINKDTAVLLAKILKDIENNGDIENIILEVKTLVVDQVKEDEEELSQGENNAQAEQKQANKKNAEEEKLLIKTPKVDTPEVDTPEVDTPKVDTPKVDTPEVDTPKVDTPVKYQKNESVDGLSVEEATLELRKDKFLSKLLDKNLLVVESVSNSTRTDTDIVFIENETVQGQYENGKATLFAENNTAESVIATAYHEVFHAAVDTLTPKVRADLLNRLGRLSVDKNAQWILDARAAIPESTTDTDITEELGAYAITQHTLKGNNLPAGVVKWVKEFIAKVRASVYKNTGILMGSLDPAILNSLAKGWKGEGTIVSGELKYSILDDFKESKPVSDFLNAPMENLGDGNLGMAAETRLESWIRKFQDGFNRIEALGSEVEKRFNKKLDDDTNPYKVEELSSSKIARMQQYIKDTFQTRLQDIMYKNDIKPAELDSYLIAKHAEERNIHIASINKEMQDGGSGLSTADAREALKIAREGNNFEILEELSQIIYDLNNANIDIMLEGGLITAPEAKNLRSSDKGGNASGYKFYVPLKGKDGVQDHVGAGQGYSLGSGGIIAAKGRGLGNIAESPMANSFMQAEQSAIRSGKSAVGRALVKMVTENPDLSLYSMTESSYKQYVDTETGQSFEGFEESQIPEGLTEKHLKRVIVERPKDSPTITDDNGNVKTTMVVFQIDPNYKNSDEVFSVMVDGKAVMVTIKDKVAAAQLKKLNAPQLGTVLQNLAAVNRYVALINTAINPEFVITNMMRDLQTAAINLSVEYSQDMAKTVMKSVPDAIKGILNHNKGDRTSEWAMLYEDLQEQGGTIGFFGLEDSQTKYDNMKKLLETQGTTLGQARKLLDDGKEWMLKINSAIENAARLGAYKAALDAGQSKSKAASLAKNLTVNFNRKGEFAPYLNSMYLFYNASIQGSARIAKVITNPESRPYLAGMVSFGLALSLYNRASGGEDEDGVSNWEKIPEFEKQTNMIFMNANGNGTYIKIKMPYGYNIFPYLGMKVEALMNGKTTKLFPSAVDILSAAANSFSPIQGANLVDTAAPTVAKPYVQSLFNYNFMGAPIVPENKFISYPMPDSDKAFTNTNQTLKDFAKLLNSVSGGDDTTSGVIDISPETMKHFTGWMTGGAGMFVGRTIGAVDKLIRGDMPIARDIPFIRTGLGRTSNFFDGEQYYESIEFVNAAKAQLKIHQINQTGEAGEFLKENRKVIRLSKTLTGFKKRIKSLKLLRNKASNDGDHERARNLSDKIATEQRRFTRMYRAAKAD